MPIVVSRHTGEILSMPEFTQEQSDMAWEMIFRAYLRKHPEVLASIPEAPEAGEAAQLRAEA